MLDIGLILRVSVIQVRGHWSNRPNERGIDLVKAKKRTYMRTFAVPAIPKLAKVLRSGDRWQEWRLGE